MKILVSGGAGFIASHIVDVYLKAGHKVVVVDNLSSGKKENLNPAARFYQMDILDETIEEIFKKEKIEVINHHAAQIDVRKSVADPLFDARVNILGGIHLLELALKYEAKRFIFASSGGTIYGEGKGEAFPEDAPKAPFSPYGIGKMTTEYYLMFYQQSYKINTVVLRYGNVFGPRQDPHGEAGVVAIFSQRMLKKEEVSIFGNGEQLRDYVYVQDVARANLLALERGDNQPFNIASGVSISVNTLFQELKKITKYPKSAIYKPARLGELFQNHLVIKKAKSALGWEPQINLQEGLRQTVDFFQKKR